MLREPSISSMIFFSSAVKEIFSVSPFRTSTVSNEGILFSICCHSSILLAPSRRSSCADSLIVYSSGGGNKSASKLKYPSSQVSILKIVCSIWIFSSFFKTPSVIAPISINISPILFFFSDF